MKRSELIISTRQEDILKIGGAVIQTMAALYHQANEKGYLGNTRYALERWTFYVPRLMRTYAEDYRHYVAGYQFQRPLEANKFQGVPIVNGYEEHIVLAWEDSLLHPETVFRMPIIQIGTEPTKSPE